MSQCIYPYFTKGGSSVPCGRCPVCLELRAAQWVFRLEQEAKRSPHEPIFITLTYAPEHLPDGGTLVKKHWQNFMKLLRWSIPNCMQVNLKYYAVGEYGSRFDRPHYHAILFGLPPSQYDLVQTCWPHGHVVFGDGAGNIQMNSDQMGYVAGYLQKGRMVKQHMADTRIPEFSMMSKGLGLGFLTDDMRAWYEADPGNEDTSNQTGVNSPYPDTMQTIYAYQTSLTTNKSGDTPKTSSAMNSDSLTTFPDIPPEPMTTTGKKKTNVGVLPTETWLGKNLSKNENYDN